MPTINAATNTNMREARAAQLSRSLMLRWNWETNCWQVWNYLTTFWGPWKWFSITNEQARSYAAHRVPVVIEETVS